MRLKMWTKLVRPFGILALVSVSSLVLFSPGSWSHTKSLPQAIPDFQQTLALLSDQSCWDKKQGQGLHFVGCVQALNQLVAMAFHDPDVLLVPHSYYQKHPQRFSQIFRSYGQWSVVRYAPIESEIREGLGPKEVDLLRIVGERRAYEAAWKGGAKGSQSLSFQALGLQFFHLAQRATGLSETQVAVSAYNAFSEVVNDPYSQFVPLAAGFVGPHRAFFPEAMGANRNISLPPSVSMTQEQSPKGLPLGVIRIADFNDPQVADQVKAAVNQFESWQVEALVLDLRENQGGRVKSMLEVAGHFLGPDQLVATAQSVLDGSQESQWTPESSKLLTELPLVVLIGPQTASVSELLAMALQDHQRAWVLGENSFGKALGQVLLDASQWANNQQAWAQPVHYYNSAPVPALGYKQTRVQYLGPRGLSHQGYGVQPDFDVAPALRAKVQQSELPRREIDLFPFNPYNANLTPHRVTERLEEIASLSACMEAQGLAELAWEGNSKSEEVSSWEFLKAQDLIDCLRH